MWDANQARDDIFQPLSHPHFLLTLTAKETEGFGDVFLADTRTTSSKDPSKLKFPKKMSEQALGKPLPSGLSCAPPWTDTGNCPSLLAKSRLPGSEMSRPEALQPAPKGTPLAPHEAKALLKSEGEDTG